MRHILSTALVVIFALVCFAQESYPLLTASNLEGIWQKQADGPIDLERVDSLKGYKDRPFSWCRVMLDGKCISGTMYFGMLVNNDAQMDRLISFNGHETWMLNVIDLDHLIANGVRYKRLNPKADDVPSERTNRFHVTADFAQIREKNAEYRKGMDLSRCWLGIEAQQEKTSQSTIPPR